MGAAQRSHPPSAAPNQGSNSHPALAAPSTARGGFRHSGDDGTGGNRFLRWAPTLTGGGAVGALLTVAPITHYALRIAFQRVGKFYIEVGALTPNSPSACLITCPVTLISANRASANGCSTPIIRQSR